MNKLTKHILTACCLLMMATGCEDKLLDLTPRDQLSVEVVFSSLEDIEKASLGMYERGRVIYSDNSFCLYKTFYTDLIAAGTNITDQAVWNQMMTFQNFDANNGGVSTIWNVYYRGLFLANSIIENVDLVEVNENVASEVARKDAVLGEGLFFRAYFHLNLVEYWDNIFLADRVFSDFENVDLAAREDVYALIVQDLEEAITLLPEASAVTSRGRVSKGVARHMLSLAYMDIGSMSLTVDGVTDPFGEAATLAEEVINDPAYSLLPEAQLADIFAVQTEENSEIIFSWQFNEGADVGPRQRTSQQLVPLYDRINGVSRTFDQGGRPWGRAIPTDYYWTLFEADDPRLDAWHKRFWVYDVDTPEDPLDGRANIGDTVTAANIEDVLGLGMILVRPTTTKYWEDGTRGRLIDDADGYKNIIQFRLAEAYLIAAEAHMNAGSTASGQQRFDELRARSGRGSLPLTIDNLIDEQARELGFEGRRYPMLKRLGILVDRVKLHSPQIGQNMMPNIHTRWPIPLAEVQLLSIRQNNGYE